MKWCLLKLKIIILKFLVNFESLRTRLSHFPFYLELDFIVFLYFSCLEPKTIEIIEVTDLN